MGAALEQMLVCALDAHGERLAALAPDFRTALARLDDPGNLLFPQTLILAAAALDLQPDVILDLGTGGGNSAATFALACGHEATVYTFDLFPAWDQGLKQKLGDLLPRTEPHVRAIAGDISLCDFKPLVEHAKRVLVFWDAHGYAIADRVLTHLLPLISERPHLVICHDISDNRVGGVRSYDGKPFWRGVEGANKIANTAYANLGWVTSRVEQVVPILDFCWRNDIELQSLDYELHRVTLAEDRVRWLTRLGAPTDATFAIAYFKLGDAPRQFPASAL